MEFVVENLSPTRKKIAFTLTADDVNAAINTAVKGFQKVLSLPGFRKGKVPALRSGKALRRRRVRPRHAGRDQRPPPEDPQGLQPDPRFQHGNGQP